MRGITDAHRCARSALLALAALAAGARSRAGATRSAPPPLKNGGTLTIGARRRTRTRSTRRSRARSSAASSSSHMCEKLYDLDAKLKIVPQLAAALPQFSADKQTFTIKLRTGIKFNDGTRVQRRRRQEVARPPHDAARGRRARARSRRSTSVDARGQLHRRAPPDARYSPLTAQLADRAGMIMSPKQLDDARRQVRDEPGLRRRRSCSRTASPATTSRSTKSPYYYDEEQGPPRRDRLQDHHRPGCARRRTCAPATSTSSDAHRVDRRAGDRRDKSLQRCSSRRRSATRASRSTSATRTALGKAYENVGTPLAQSADLRAGVRARARPQGDQQGRLRRARRSPTASRRAGQPVVRRRRRGCRAT